MNDDGAFILAETRRNQEDLRASFYWHHIYNWFWRVWEDVCHMYCIGTCLLKKTDKNDTEQLRCNSVLAQIFLALGAASSCSTFWIALHAIRECFRKHNILQFIY